MLNLEWRPRAHLDRESIALYLGVECAAPQAALRAMEKLDEAILRAREQPDMGGNFHFEELDHKLYRTVQASPYIIYYRYNDKTLTVYRILHQRQEVTTYALVDF